MLTVFIAITGGLLTVAYSNSIEISAQILCFNILSFAGVWVSIVFLIFEIALNIYLSGLWSELDADSSLYRHPIIKWMVRLAAISLPFFLLIFWSLIYKN
jgi:hypothetical protein